MNTSKILGLIFVMICSVFLGGSSRPVINISLFLVTFSVGYVVGAFDDD